MMIFRRAFAQMVSKKGAVLPSQRFSSQKKPDQQVDEDEDDDRGRNVDAEAENEKITENASRRSTFWTLYRIVFWSFTAMFGYSLYNIAQSNGDPRQITFKFPGIHSAAEYTYGVYNQIADFFLKPPSKKFLADPLHPALHPKTLVLHLSGALVKNNFRFGKGIEVIKRPGLDAFLRRLSKSYEIIIFTDDDYNTIMTASNAIDPTRQIISGAFGKESMVLEKGTYFKDMSYLNRELKNVVVIEKGGHIKTKQKRNVIELPEFEGSEDDKQLSQLLPFLQHLASPEVRDVRPIIQGMGASPYRKYMQILRKKEESMRSKTSWMNRMTKKSQGSK